MMGGKRRGASSKSKAPRWSAPALAAGCLVFSFLLLLVFGRAGDSETRIAALESRLKTLQANERMPGDTSAFPPGSVCHGKLPPDYAERVRVAVSGGGLEVKELIVTGAIPTETRVPVQSYGVSLKARGTYEAAVAAVGSIGRLGPILFVDTASLRNRSDAVDLELKGRVFCR
jgi:hypothetical protein